MSNIKEIAHLLIPGAIVTGRMVEGRFLYCRAVRFENLCDVAESGPPTCPTCAKRAASLVGGWTT